MMIRVALLLALFSTLSACTWDTYQDERGHTHLRQRYPNGTGVYYTNGAASQNTHYHDARPEPHAIIPENHQ